VARLFGIELRVHISWVFIFAIVLYSLWSDVFAHYGWSDQKRITVSAIAALLFFSSIVAHELSHSLVARRFNMAVSSITLFLLGGVANLRQEPPSAKAEFFMAAAGPGMSLVISGIGLALWFGIDTSALPSLQPVSAVAGYLGVINLALAGFNLLPGFPLDGGRVLRSIIWGSAGTGGARRRSPRAAGSSSPACSSCGGSSSSRRVRTRSGGGRSCSRTSCTTRRRSPSARSGSAASCPEPASGRS